MAQNYPVQATLRVMPPYSVFLSDYGSRPNALSLDLQLKDPFHPDIISKLRLRIESTDFVLTTRPDYFPEQFLTVSAGFVSLEGLDIAEYFNPASLIVEAKKTSQADFENNPKIPEGLVKISIQVIEMERDRPISNEAFTYFRLSANLPPIINMPQDKGIATIYEPQNVFFQWTPRHSSSLNLAATGGVVYNMTLCEVWDEDRDINEVLLSTPPLFEGISQNTSFMYGINEPPLVPGRKYALRVQAQAINDDRDVFENQGFSQVISFRYGPPCLPPTSVLPQIMSGNTLKLQWKTDLGHTGYNLEIAQATAPPAPRGGASTSANNPTTAAVPPLGARGLLGTSFLSPSLPDGVYEISISSICGNTR
jgi:hypothetical protein